MVLVIDNYDSFTYNIVQYMGEFYPHLEVIRNDRITVDAIQALRPRAIVISPGPCTPNEAGISLQVVAAFAGKVPLFGVCLGHQVIAQASGARIVRADTCMHGKTSMVVHDGKGIFRGVPSPVRATRYHSLLVDPESLPATLQVSAWTREGEIMGVRGADGWLEGVQFHPESILTEHGRRMILNFLETAGVVGEEKHVRVY
jgi:para-aminobenzoate synthetase component 2